MSNLEQQRRKKEADAYAREEAHRAERRIIEDRERDRHKRDLERQRLQEMAMDKQRAKQAEEMKLAEKKQDAMMKELEQKQAQANAPVVNQPPVPPTQQQ